MYLKAARILWSGRRNVSYVYAATSAEKVIMDDKDDMETGQDDYPIKDLLIGELGRRGTTDERGYFSSLLCFCPPTLESEPEKFSTAWRLAKKYNEEKQLEISISAIVKSLASEDLF